MIGQLCVAAVGLSFAGPDLLVVVRAVVRAVWS